MKLKDANLLIKSGVVFNYFFYKTNFIKMEAHPETFTLAAIYPPNPITKRAFRVKWSMKPSTEGQQIVAYGSGKNLVIRDL